MRKGGGALAQSEHKEGRRTRASKSTAFTDGHRATPTTRQELQRLIQSKINTTQGRRRGRKAGRIAQKSKQSGRFNDGATHKHKHPASPHALLHSRPVLFRHFCPHVCAGISSGGFWGREGRGKGAESAASRRTGQNCVRGCSGPERSFMKGGELEIRTPRTRP